MPEASGCWSSGTFENIKPPMQATLHIGGLVAAGFDPSGRFLLTVSHDGRGVFDTQNWERVSRDRDLAYPEQGFAYGIGPLSDQRIPVVERGDSPELEFVCPDGSTFYYAEGTVTITPKVRTSAST